MSDSRLIELILTPTYGWQRGVFEGFSAYAMERPWMVHAAVHGNAGELPRFWSDEPDAIITSIMTDDLAAILQGTQIPCVNIYAEERSPRALDFAVTPDWRQVAELAVEHLLGCGLKNIAFAGVGRHPWIQLVKDQLSSCAEQHDLSFSLLECQSSAGDGWQEELQQWVPTLPRPLGIITEAILAGHCIHACKLGQIMVPEQAAVLALDDNYQQAIIGKMPVSLVDLPGFEAGQVCGRLLDALFDGQPLPQSWQQLPAATITAQRSTDMTAIDDAIVAYALAIMNRDPLSRHTIADIASRVGVATRTLNMHFQKELGRSAKSELLRVRMQAAQEMLADPQLSIADVAMRCGFRSPAQFSRDFHRVVGVKPSELR